MRHLTLTFLLFGFFLLSDCQQEELLPPAKPELDTPENNSTNTELNLPFEWTESPDADSYNFQLSTQLDFSSIEVNKTDLSTTSTDVENLRPITTYYWRVNAENEGGVSPWSNTNKFTTKSLIIPTLIFPTDNSSQTINNIQFSWDAINDVSGYNLQVSTTNDFSGLIINKTNLTSTSLKISGFMYSTHYYWRVSSIKNSTNSDWSVTRSFTTESLGIPSLISPDNNSKSLSINIMFKWSTVAGADNYVIQVSSLEDFSSLASNKPNLTSVTVTSADFKLSTKYYWRVSAMVANCQSEWSAIRSFTTPAIPTEGLVAWYPFNGNVNDESGNGNQGIINGGVATTSDRYDQLNKAYIFNGTSGYIEIPSLNNFQYKPITYSAWVIVSSYFPLSSGIKFRSIIGRQEQFNTTCGMVGFYADKNVANGAYDNTFLYWMGATSSPDVPYSKNQPTLNTWAHVVYTQANDGTFAFYINGILTNSGNITNSQNANISFRIGAGIGANAFYWNDKIDDVRIYNRVLNSEEILVLYSE